jgi:hypothetical protein
MFRCFSRYLFLRLTQHAVLPVTDLDLAAALRHLVVLIHSYLLHILSATQIRFLRQSFPSRSEISITNDA